MASNSTFIEKSAESQFPKLPPVILRKELHDLIKTVKEMELVTTYQEVLDGLRKYIVERKLFDENNIYKVHCKDDELGCVLGVEEFMVSDLKTLLRKIVVPVNKTQKDSAEVASLSSDNPLKRKYDESVESEQRKLLAVDVKVHTSSPLLLHIPPSPSYFSTSDSVDSVQGYETAFVKDTSDEFLSAENGEERILAIEDIYNIEYEVETDSEDDDASDSEDSDDTESDGDPESVVLFDAAIMTFLSKPESDIEFFADDSSEDDGEYDREITEKDLWKCKICDATNKPPMRYCLRCFEERINWLPDKPSRKKRRPRKTTALIDKDFNEASVLKYHPDSQESSSSGSCCKTRENVSEPSSDLFSPSAVDSPFAESTSSYCIEPTSLCSVESSDSNCMESVCSPCMEPIGSSCIESESLPACKPMFSDTLNSVHFEPAEPFCMKSINISCIEASGLSSMESSGPCSMESISSVESTCSSSVESASHLNAEPSCSSNMSLTESLTKLCIICCASPASASIIHGKYAHQISCYKCARKLKKQKKGCPVCRRTIDRVVHQINI